MPSPVQTWPAFNSSLWKLSKFKLNIYGTSMIMDILRYELNGTPEWINSWGSSAHMWIFVKSEFNCIAAT